MAGTEALIRASEPQEGTGEAQAPLPPPPLPGQPQDEMVEPRPAEAPDGPLDWTGDEAVAGDPDGEGESAGDGIWWTDYREPEKPIADYTAREVGRRGEALAARYLTQRGMRLITQNWRCKAGEVDIVAEDDGEIALVEVKTRLDLDGDPDTMPELAVDGRKQRRYRRLALIYLMLHPHIQRLRFDVIAINILSDHSARLRHLVGTFTVDS